MPTCSNEVILKRSIGMSKQLSVVTVSTGLDSLDTGM